MFFRSPAAADPAMLMSPNAIEPGLADGREQARRDLQELADF